MSEVAFTFPTFRLLMTRVSTYIELFKPRLAFLVVFSSSISYLIANGGTAPWLDIIFLSLGGFLITGGANGLNQVIEMKQDAIMDRTKDRPIPTGRLLPSEAAIVSLLAAFTGIAILFTSVNAFSALLGTIALLLYVVVYTPLKKHTSLAVFVGAIPGAMPPLIGWVAATGTLNYFGVMLFAIQFIWQFPHFWAIAWRLHDDYKKVGYHLLPSKGGRNKNSAFQIVLYSLVLIPVSLLPVKFELGGWITLIVSVIAGLFLFGYSVVLYKKLDISSASKVMFASLLYLPIVQLSLLIDILL
ncbi:MAG: protoheme IX farnesyltransferase [Sphingobacteriales bacterium]|jgi:protoheme IX farnesyltransferase